MITVDEECNGDDLFENKEDEFAESDNPILVEKEESINYIQNRTVKNIFTDEENPHMITLGNLHENLDEFLTQFYNQETNLDEDEEIINFN